jgi:hypothetical protein
VGNTCWGVDFLPVCFGHVSFDHHICPDVLGSMLYWVFKQWLTPCYALAMKTISSVPGTFCWILFRKGKIDPFSPPSRLKIRKGTEEMGYDEGYEDKKEYRVLWVSKNYWEAIVIE